MQDVETLLANNQAWAATMVARDPAFFQKLAQQQAPGYLWIGCSDSRVPATQVVGLVPGELFVHRNIANVVAHTDRNCLAVLHYAVEILNVKHIIVCGHYGCGGVQAALQNTKLGLIDKWLRHVQNVRSKHDVLLTAIQDETSRLNRLCELNVVEQVVNVSQTTVVQHAWERRQALAVHGWIYGLQDGLLHNLGMVVRGPDELSEQYARAISASG